MRNHISLYASWTKERNGWENGKPMKILVTCIPFQACNAGLQQGNNSDSKFKITLLPHSPDQLTCHCSRSDSEVESYVLQHLILCPCPRRHWQVITCFCWAWLGITSILDTGFLAGTTDWLELPCEMNQPTPGVGGTTLGRLIGLTKNSGYKQCKTTSSHNVRDSYQYLF